MENENWEKEFDNLMMNHYVGGKVMSLFGYNGLRSFIRTKKAEWELGAVERCFRETQYAETLSDARERIHLMRQALTNKEQPNDEEGG